MLCVRPEHVSIQKSISRQKNVFEGTIEKILFTGEILDCWVKIGEQRLRVHMSSIEKVEEGEKVYVHIDPRNAVLLDKPI